MTIKEEIRRSGFRQWQVAAAAGIGETTLCVWLRKKPTLEQTERIRAALDKLIEERGVM